MPKIEYEIGDDVDLIEVDEYKGLKIPSSYMQKHRDGAQIAAIKSAKHKFIENFRDILVNEEIDIDKMSVKDISQLVAKNFSEKLEAVVKGQPGQTSQPSQINTTQEDFEKKLEQERAKFKSEIETSLAKEREKMQQENQIVNSKAKIKALLNGINPNAVQYLDNMIDNVVDFETLNGVVMHRAKGDKDKYLYNKEGKPMSESEIADRVKKANEFAFTKPKNGFGGNLSGGNAIANGNVDFIKMTSSQIAELVK